MGIIRCASPGDLEPILQQLARERGSALFVFFGSEDPQTGQSWCPDCVTADPVLRRSCRELRPDLVLYECPVGIRSEWKNRPEHPYRVHPALRLQRIPTLVFLHEGCERGRLVEGDCAKPELVKAFLAP